MQNSAYLGLALHKLVQEGGEGEVPEGVPIIGDVGARQQGAGEGCHAGVHVTPQAGQLPPTRPVPPAELWLPATSIHQSINHTINQSVSQSVSLFVSLSVSLKTS